MARISLVICDLCKCKMQDEESQEEYSIVLSSLNIDKTIGEICSKCFKSLMYNLNRPAVPKPVEQKTTAPVTQASSKAPVIIEGQATSEPPIGPSENEKAEREPTEELLADEINKVPSKFDMRIARAALIKIRGGTCLHHFTSMRDGKIVCIDAPGGIEGELAGAKGCGERISERAFQVSKPRSFAFTKPK